MSYSTPTSPPKCHNPRIVHLIQRIAETERTSETEHRTNIQTSRKIHHSHSLATSRRAQFSSRPKFNTNFKQEDLLDKNSKPIPYVFIPAFKNQTFMMPDRAFAKGKAAKRLFIKMKDTFVNSFREAEDDKTSKLLKKEQKQQTIISRRVEEYNRVVNSSDGRRKAEQNKWFLKNRKKFTPTNNFEFFSQCDPMLQPAENETKLIRKISLAKTFDFRNKWRPATRGSQAFSASAAASLYAEHYPTSVA